MEVTEVLEAGDQADGEEAMEDTVDMEVMVVV